MRLFIAEKPSLGRALADVLPKPLRKSEGAIVAANGDTVTWCIGHLLEQAEPEAYDPAFKKWSHQHLPIIPAKWQLNAKKKTAQQLKTVIKLIKQADQLVHAGDPDREGQLLVDEVIHFAGVGKNKVESVQRCLISDLNAAAVKRAVMSLKPNREFMSLSISALARSRADWLYGINLTRAYTLQGQKAGYNGVLSVGRVQTPVLGLVVRRDQEINSFVSRAYFQVWANLQTESGEQFKAKWLPSKDCEAHLDDQGRNLSKPLAENVAKRISNKPAVVSKLKRQLKKQSAPLPYNLSALQIDCSKAFGLSAKQVLDTCQTLYERHKLISYPRSDCRHLPLEHFSQAQALVKVIQSNAKFSNESEKLFGESSDSAKVLNIKQKSRAWNDAKVSAHHAIIPTLRKLSSGLNAIEEKIYRLICRNYLAQFMPVHEFYAVEVEVAIATGKFSAKAKEQVAFGWRVMFGSNKSHESAMQSSSISGEDDDPVQKIPLLEKGQALRSLIAEVLEKQTSPPKSYTDASLLAAMTGISKHVIDPDLRKILRETDGLGTEATRAGIIELLFKRGFLRRKAKTIYATPTGRALIEALPEVATQPDLTARWESQLSAIHDGSSNYQALMSPLESQLQLMVDDSQKVLPRGLRGLGGKPKFKRKRSYKTAKTPTKAT